MAIVRKRDTKENIEGKLNLLIYLSGIAQKTEGAEVWRALFAEMIAVQARKLNEAE